jgi:hypothetical protein
MHRHQQSDDKQHADRHERNHCNGHVSGHGGPPASFNSRVRSIDLRRKKGMLQCGANVLC